MIRRPRRSPLFPYTPLSRSVGGDRGEVHLPRQAGPLRGAEGRQAVEPPRGERPLPGHDPAAGRKVGRAGTDRKSTRLNSSHSQISYAVFCLKKKKEHDTRTTIPDPITLHEDPIRTPRRPPTHLPPTTSTLTHSRRLSITPAYAPHAARASSI